MKNKNNELNCTFFLKDEETTSYKNNRGSQDQTGLVGGMYMCTVVQRLLFLKSVILFVDGFANTFLQQNCKESIFQNTILLKT